MDALPRYPLPPTIHQRIGIAPRRKQVALRRLAYLQHLCDLMADGHSQNFAAREVSRRGNGEPAAMTLIHWWHTYRRIGFVGLLPNTHLCGRKPKPSR